MKLLEPMRAGEGKQRFVGRVLREPDSSSAKLPKEFDATPIEEFSKGAKGVRRHDKKEAKLPRHGRLDRAVSKKSPVLRILGNELMLDARIAVEVAAVVVPRFLRASPWKVRDALVR